MLLREGEAGQLSGLNIEGNGSRLTAPEGFADGKVGALEIRTASLGPDAMGTGGVMEPMLGHTEEGTLGHEGTGADGHEGMGADGHEGTGVDEPMEETLGGTEDGPEDDGTEQVTMVEYMWYRRPG